MTTFTKSSAGRWKIVSVISVFVNIGLFVGILVLVLHRNNNDQSNLIGNEPGCNGENDQPNSHIQNGDPSEPSVFHDLTEREISGLMAYLHATESLNLVHPTDARVNNSYLYLAELYVAAKSDILAYLDNDGPKPTREAFVMIFRGDKSPPVVEEYLVGPLPNPTYTRDIPGRRKPIPFNLRPFTGPDFSRVIEYAENAVHESLSDLVRESYGGSFQNCGDTCIILRSVAPYSSAVSGDLQGRKIWLTMVRKLEYYMLHPVDFAVLINIDQENHDISIKNVWYNGQTFDSLQQLADGYRAGSVNTTTVPYPQLSNDLFSTMHRRGTPFQTEFKREPIQIEPDGKRYTINGNHITYMGWKFYYRMSTVSGPQIYDVQFNGDRIVYELSLQEIVVFYSGFSPSQMFKDIFDSLALLGPEGKGLVPGIDCPTDATFIDTKFVLEWSEGPVTIKNAFCVFEFNTGYPLRRHHTPSALFGNFYEGMPDTVLTFRTIITIANYDYLFDYIFFQNGVVQVKTVSTGYIIATFHTANEAPFGTEVHENTNGNLHTHLFNFKVDIDVKGSLNRFETLDIAPTSLPNAFSTNASALYHMTKFARNLKTTEMLGAYKYNFEMPKYLTFYNEQEKNTFGNPMAYRIENRGMVKQLFAEEEGNEPSASWARYQVAVTKYKETERTSSSPYAYLDAADPVVQFQTFINDNESIVDEDLVVWMTMGMHHIPHTEDLPVTPSPGMDLSFFLFPYNYFTEDPAIVSKSSVRIELKDDSKPEDGARVIRYGPTTEKTCFKVNRNNYFNNIQDNPEILLDV